MVGRNRGIKWDFRVRLSRVGEVNDAMPNYQNKCCNKGLKQTSWALFIS